jgi:arylformamidase
LFWKAPGAGKLYAVVGEHESAEYFRQSKTIVDCWGGAGVAARFDVIPNANHFTVISALGDPQSAMTSRLSELALR